MSVNQASLYNRERLSQLPSAGHAVTPQELEQWLIQAASWVRASLQPSINSLNLIQPDAKGGGELQDNLADNDHASLIDALIDREELTVRKQEQGDLNQILQEAIATLSSDNQAILSFYYQQQLTQKEIAQQLNLKQYTISRRLNKIRERLLNALVQWSQEHLHISLTPAQLVTVSTTLEEWLSQYNASTQDAYPPEIGALSAKEGAA